MSSAFRLAFIFVALALFQISCKSRPASDQAHLAKSNGSNSEMTALPERLVFSRDHRRSDGDLQELTILKVNDGKYDVTFRSARIDRIKGESVDDTKSLGTGMTCRSEGDHIVCRIDRRPVDGNLVEIDVFKNKLGLYDVSVRTISERMGEDLKIVGTQLSRK